MFVAIVSGMAILAGLFIPTRWGLVGFLATATALYLAFFTMLALRGFEGLPLAESLLLFEGSMTAYLGFNLQVAYRAFALPLLVLAALIILRQQRAVR